MKTLFTIHAGEFVVGDYIERKFRRVNLWMPSQDTGVDLLVTDSKNEKTISLQVKFSRDFLATHMPAIFQKPLRACGWWSLNRQKILNSKADYWVFVLVGFERRSTDFVVIKPSELLARLDKIHGKAKTIQSYLWVTEKNRCWETRGLRRQEQLAITQGQYLNGNGLGCHSDRKKIFPLRLLDGPRSAGLSASLFHQVCQLFLAEGITLTAELTTHIGRVLLLTHSAQLLSSKRAGQIKRSTPEI